MGDECIHKTNSYVTVVVVKHTNISDVEATKIAIGLLKELS